MWAGVQIKQSHTSLFIMLWAVKISKQTDRLIGADENLDWQSIITMGFNNPICKFFLRIRINNKDFYILVKIPVSMI